MPDTIEPIFSYPSRQSVIHSVLATIERSSIIDYPEDWDDNAPLYLKVDDAVWSRVFHEAVNNSINEAEPAPWLLRALNEFEQMVVEYIIEDLEDTSDGLIFVNGMRATAKRRSWEERQQEQHSDDAE